jgi:hypothetical protein
MTHAKIGTSLAGFEIPLVVIKQRSSGIVRSVFQKPIVMLVARQHPGEHASSIFLEKLV